VSKRKKKQSGWRRELRRNAGWVIAGVAAAAAVFGLAALVLSGGSSSDDVSGSAATPTPDARVAGATPALSVTVEANDDGQSVNPRFEPDAVESDVGKVLEIVVRNTGSVAHNLRVSGEDRQYDTRDDFTSRVVQPDNETSVVVLMEMAGTYPFRCDLHPQQQVGTLVIDLGNRRQMMGCTFELTIPEAGLYPFVTHSFAYTGLGAVGVINVGGATGEASH
jgi:plastocyanin